MVLGLFSSNSSAENALNNLYEADYSLENASVIAQDSGVSQDLTDYSGPIGRQFDDSAYRKLSQSGLGDTELKYYRDQVNEGYILIAINTGSDSDPNASEILSSAGGKDINEVKDV